MGYCLKLIFIRNQIRHPSGHFVSNLPYLSYLSYLSDLSHLPWLSYLLFLSYLPYLPDRSHLIDLNCLIYVIYLILSYLTLPYLILSIYPSIYLYIYMNSLQNTWGTTSDKNPESFAKQTKKQWNYLQNQTKILGTIWNHTKNPWGLWVKVENPWKSGRNSAQFLFMMRKLLSYSGENETKYEASQPSSASSFEPIRKVAFKSYIALRIIQGQKQ
jgi:hypothetical protein